MDYLGLVDELPAAGVGRLGARFREAQAAFITGLRCDDGGFPGRRGTSDVYYSEFALRGLVLLGAEQESLEPTANFLGSARPPRTVVESFSLLNSLRLLRRAGVQGVPSAAAGVADVLAQQAAPGGGWAHPGSHEVSAYNTLLGTLCAQMVGADVPRADDLERAMLALRRSDGGFAERGGEAGAQASATAAALGVLGVLDRLSAQVARPGLSFLSGLQADDGGFRAHPQAPAGDLLSTFTALFSLALLCDMTDVDVPRAGRFVRSVACPAGGFRACAADDCADAEYAYYGLGCLGILGGVARPV